MLRRTAVVPNGPGAVPRDWCVTKLRFRMAVPEIWRWVDSCIKIHLRRRDGSYCIGPRSACFPWLPIDELTAWLGRYDNQGMTTFIRAFRAWVSESVRPD